MTPLDLAALEAAARAATPGPWEFLASTVQIFSGNTCVAECSSPMFGEEMCASDNAQFISAANPAVVLALIERVRVAEEQLSAMYKLTEDNIVAAIHSLGRPSIEICSAPKSSDQCVSSMSDNEKWPADSDDLIEGPAYGWMEGD